MRGRSTKFDSKNQKQRPKRRRMRLTIVIFLERDNVIVVVKDMPPCYT